MTLFLVAESYWMTTIQEHRWALSWIAAFSVLLFVGCLIVVPWLVVRIPADYFVGRRRPKTVFTGRHPILRWSGLIAKNCCGAVLVLAGLLMLILPGQGILTIAIGIMMLDFPGKRRLEQSIIRWPPVLRSINWLRRKRNTPPLQIDVAPE